MLALKRRERMRWAGKSGHTNAPADRLRNDFIDTTYAAYATFFDGLITKDKQLSEAYDDAVRFLGTLFKIGMTGDG